MIRFRRFIHATLNVTIIKIVRYFSWLGAAALVCGLICFAVWWIRLPRYQGSTIYHWFNQGVSLFGGRPFVGQSETQEIEGAFQAMGPEASRFLVQQIKADAKSRGRDFSKFPWSLALNRHMPNAIRQYLLTPVPQRRNVALLFLEKLGPQNLIIQRELEEILPTVTGYETSTVLNIFREIGPAASNSIPAIAKCFESKDEGTRLFALEAFAALTPTGSPHIVLLNEAVRNHFIRAARAIPVLKQLDAEYFDLLPILGLEFQSTDMNKQVEAFMIYDSLPEEKKHSLMHALALSLEKSAARIKGVVLKRMQKCPAESAAEIDSIIPLLHNEYYFVRAEAARTLGFIGTNAHPALDELKKLENDPQPEVAEAGLQAERFIRR